MDKLVKQWQWIECPVCKNDRKLYPNGCISCNQGKYANPGFIQGPSNKY